MFVGRQQELEQLNNAYDSGKFECAVISGRRHLGKTSLISEFLRDKPAIRFTAREVTDKYNLDTFTGSVADYFGIDKNGLSDWDSAFKTVYDNMSDERLVLVLENYTDACLTNKELSSTLGNAIDCYYGKSKLFLIISCNHMSTLDREILGKKSVLRRYITLHLNLRSLAYDDAIAFMDGFEEEDKLKLYRCIGGTPLYLSMIDNNETFEENIIRLFFRRCGFIYNDVSMTLQKELIVPAVYNSLLRAVAHGYTKAREICDETGEESGKTHKYLNVLLSMGVLCEMFLMVRIRISAEKEPGVLRTMPTDFGTATFWITRGQSIRGLGR